MPRLTSPSVLPRRQIPVSGRIEAWGRGGTWDACGRDGDSGGGVGDGARGGDDVIICHATISSRGEKECVCNVMVIVVVMC